MEFTICICVPIIRSFVCIAALGIRRLLRCSCILHIFCTFLCIMYMRISMYAYKYVETLYIYNICCSYIYVLEYKFNYCTIVIFRVLMARKHQTHLNKCS